MNKDDMDIIDLDRDSSTKRAKVEFSAFDAYMQRQKAGSGEKVQDPVDMTEVSESESIPVGSKAQDTVNSSSSSDDDSWIEDMNIEFIDDSTDRIPVVTASEDQGEGYAEDDIRDENDKSYARSYHESENNVADMLAEYDAIETDNILAPKKRKSASGSQNRARKAAPADHAHSDRHSSKDAHDTASAKAKAERPMRNKYADAMYDEVEVKETRKKKPSDNAQRTASKAAAGAAGAAAASKSASGHEKAAHDASAATKSANARRRAAHRTKNEPTHEDFMYRAERSLDFKEDRERLAAERRNQPKEPSAWSKFVKWFKGLTALDYIVAATSLVVIVAGVIVASVFSSAKANKSKISEFEKIGTRLADIGVAGQYALIAAADNKGLSFDDVEETELEFIPDIPEYEEKEEEDTGTVNVTMNLQSVVKDLKIKFVNKKTKKLIAGLQFKAEVTDSDGKKTTYTDDDKDGIIYISKIKHGKTKVQMIALEGVGDYNFDTSIQNIDVKESLEYKKIDVSDEVKKESQVNAAVEDTAQATQVEATLTDTVEWVESTKTQIGGGENTFILIDKSKIQDPNQTSSAKNNFVYEKAVTISKMMAYAGDPPEGGETPSEGTTPAAGENGEQNNSTEQPAEATPSPTPETPAPETPAPSEISVSLEGTFSEMTVGDVKNLSVANGVSVNWSSSDESIASVSSGSVTAKAPGNVTITATSTEDSSKTATCSITVKAKQELSISLDKTSLSIEPESSSTLTASVNGTDNKKVIWSSDDAGIAVVDENGRVTGKKGGKTTIRAQLDADNSKVASCEVTVVVALSLNKSSISIKVGGTDLLKATVSGPNDATIIWTSDDPNIATIASDGIVKGIKAGTTKINATLKSDQSVKTSCTVTVTAKAELKDTSGNQVYIKKSDGKFYVATSDDYANYSEFYIKSSGGSGEYRYTGWQTIDGATYFFDKNGNKITGEQVIQGARYTFDSNGVLQAGSGVLGIDVSKWNGSIDWNKVRNSGISYVIIRCGYRGSTSGALIEDPTFKTNIKGATAAGLNVGIYFFTQATNEVEAVEEASMTVSLISGYKITYPVFLDVEASGGRGDKIDASTRTAVINAYCQTISNSGYAAGVYANKTWLSEKFNPGGIGNARVWLAQYNTTPTYGGKYNLWQYTSKGKVSGISGNVDMNLSYLGY